jgi:hypothetical protein
MIEGDRLTAARIVSSVRADWSCTAIHETGGQRRRVGGAVRDAA